MYKDELQKEGKIYRTTLLTILIISQRQCSLEVNFFCFMIEGPDLYYPLQKANIDVGAVRAFNEQTCNRGKKRAWVTQKQSARANNQLNIK